MILDQARAATLTGVHRWRIVYHYQTSNGDAGLDRTETTAWFHISDQTAWADAAAQLPPTGYPHPQAVTVERGTFAPAAEGGYCWRHVGPTLVARVDHTGLVYVGEDEDLETDVQTKTAEALAATGQQTLF